MQTHSYLIARFCLSAATTLSGDELLVVSHINFRSAKGWEVSSEMYYLGGKGKQGLQVEFPTKLLKFKKGVR